MQITIFNTPILTPILQLLSITFLKLIGWRAVGEVPKDLRKYVIVAAPHTSNWDFPMFVFVVCALRLNLNVFVKHTLFVGPLGWFYDTVEEFLLTVGLPELECAKLFKNTRRMMIWSC